MPDLRGSHLQWFGVLVTGSQLTVHFFNVWSRNLSLFSLLFHFSTLQTNQERLHSPLTTVNDNTNGHPEPFTNPIIVQYRMTFQTERLADFRRFQILQSLWDCYLQLLKIVNIYKIFQRIHNGKMSNNVCMQLVLVVRRLVCKTSSANVSNRLPNQFGSQHLAC